MFDLVVDVERYQDFMPMDFSARIIKRDTENILAKQTLHIGPMSLGFESSANFRRPEWIRIESTSEPFSKFLIAWNFVRVEHGCNVRVRVDCTTHSVPLSALLTPWIETFTRVLISAFERRAAEIYAHVNRSGISGDEMY